MKNKKNTYRNTGFIVLSAVLFLFLSFPAFSSSHYKYAIKQGMDVYFGHISYIQNLESQPIVYKEDQLGPEYAVLNFPIAPGNTVRTQGKGRCEVQFDTGTLLRLEENTEITIETVLAQSLSSRKKMTNLVLKKGTVYVMYKSYMTLELFQIMTPNAAVKMNPFSVTLVSAHPDGSTDVKVMQGKAFVMYGPDENNLREEKIKQGQSARVEKDHGFEYLENISSPDFESWNKKINQNFQKLHEGKTPLPKPVYRYPDAVIYFAEKYSTTYGEWLWDEYYGYVWRPFHYRYYPSGWQPYSFGQWTAVNGQMFWVPQEPWGWAPYHLGVWVWNKKKGWLWIPGSVFSPAWVCWNYVIRPGIGTGYFIWRPWTVLDWVDWSFIDFSWMHDDADVGIDNPWLYDEQDIGEHIPDANLQSLAKKNDPCYVLTGRLKKVFKNVKKAVQNGEKELISTYSYIRGNPYLVKHESLISPDIQKKIMDLDQLGENWDQALTRLSQGELQEKIVGAYRTLRNPDIKRPSVQKSTKFSDKASGKHISSMPVKTAAATHEKRETIMRFRDWNPDIEVARDMGVSIIYSGVRNEIQCPELRLSSGKVRITPFSKISSGSAFYSQKGGGRGFGAGSSSGKGSSTATKLTSKTSSSSSSSRSSKTKK
ncbi:MAG: hypothetical protein GF421_12450 [Candidatus Aminicenantes bacterium]|nr:hypothetical protein [Candidatus Aminicenantes bacterium]